MNLLGSMGTDPPQMSLLNLAFMWAAMSEVGIWFPSSGIHGICRMLAAAVGFAGGEIRLRCPAVRILVENGRAAGVRTEDGGEIRAPAVIVNADYKKTFLELLDPADLPPAHLAAVRDVPYSGSELCVHLGVDPRRIDWSRMKAEHLFYREREDSSSEHDPLDFADREIEICRWSDNAPDCAPPGKAVLVLRVGLPYSMFEDWRTGEKLRKPGYREAKNRMARALIKTVEGALPGLRGSVEVMEAATPLTYRDWGKRTDGSTAGWTWSAEAAARLPGKLLVETPVECLYMAGVYAATELFLGGVPTALQTGSLAADRVLGR
jgi:all-trans-retinol 13,14-reductase